MVMSWSDLRRAFVALAIANGVALVLVHTSRREPPKDDFDGLFTITPGTLEKAKIDRAVAWCSRVWDPSSAKLAEAVLERVHTDADGNAATTVANLLLRATEAHMRTSDWSASSAIGAASSLDQRYKEVLQSAAGLLYDAAKRFDHHGAHYSLALLLKLYPSLLNTTDGSAAAAAAHLCASRRATVDRLRSSSVSGRTIALNANATCSDIQVVTPPSDLVLSYADSSDNQRVVLVAIQGEDDDVVTVQGADAVVHDITSSSSKKLMKRPCHIYDMGAGCYPALWRQFAHGGHEDPGVRVTKAEVVGLVDGFSGSAYYHWLLDVMPRLLYLADALELRPLDKRIPVFLPVPTGSFVDETIQLFPSSLFRSFSALHYRGRGLILQAKKILAVGLDGDRKTHRGSAAVLYPSRPLVKRLRGALALKNDPPSTLVLVVRGLGEARAFGNREAVTAALAGVAAARGLTFALFDANTTMSATVRLFNSATLVVGVHGAGLANIVFCHPTARVLELGLPEPEFAEYRILSRHLNLTYAVSYLPHSNFEARVWPRPNVVAKAAAALLDDSSLPPPPRSSLPPSPPEDLLASHLLPAHAALSSSRSH